MLVHFAVEATARRLERRGRRTPARTPDVWFGGGDAGEGTARLVARVSPRSPRSPSASQVELAVDTSRLYFFDPRDAAEGDLALDGAGGQAGQDPLLQDEDRTISGSVTMIVAAMICPHGCWNALPDLPDERRDRDRDRVLVRATG